MKKMLFTALAVMALSACANDIVTDVQQSAIDFASDAQCAVKSTLVTNENFDSFQVFAFNGANAIMDDMTVSKDDNGAWTYSPKKYWPAEGTVDFFGVYMENLGESTEEYQTQYAASADGGLMFSLDMAEVDVVNAADIPDAVYATAIGKTKADGTVQMTFRHAMAQIGFEIKNATTDANNIVVTSGDVYVEGLYYAGNYTAPKTYSTSESLGIGIGFGSWDFTETKADYLFKTDGVLIKAGETAGILADKCLALPQEATSAKFRINCTIKQGNVIIFSGEKTITVDIDWNEGWKYTYIFLIDDSIIEDGEIELTASVNPIQNAETQTIRINN